MKFSGDIRSFVDGVVWRWAKTHPECTWHEYLAREHVDADLFRSLVSHIREHGSERGLMGRSVPCFEEDGKVYWTMSVSMETTTIVNRCAKRNCHEYSQVGEPAAEPVDHPKSIGSGIGREQTLWECSPCEIKEVQNICALRFTGHEYHQEVLVAGDPPSSLGECSREVVRSLQLFEDPLKSFAAFFALQRYLGKWGGERLSQYSPQYVAFDFLFLSLYQSPVPNAFADQEYVDQWNRLEPERVESAAAYIRRSFVRIGNGPVVQG